MKAEIKTLVTLQTKLQKKYEKAPDKQLGDILLDIQTAIRSASKLQGASQ